MKNCRAVSDTVAITLIICLVLVAAMICWGFFFGYGDLLKKSINIAESARDLNTTANAHVIHILHQNGDRGLLNASLAGNYTPVQFTLIAPSGLIVPAIPSPGITDPVWQPGDSIYLYRDSSGYHVTDDITARIARSSSYGPLTDLEKGTWTVKTIDAGPAHVVINSVSVFINGNGSPAGTHYSPGLIASYYQGQTWTNLAGTRIDSVIDFTDQSSSWPSEMVGRQENFSVQWDGYILIPSDGTYSFTLTSDDGSWLWLDETMVINNGGLHSSTSVTRSVTLTAGYHPLRVRMYENTGVAVARLSIPSGCSIWHIPSTAPMTDFIGVPRAGTGPLAVQFTDTSTDATAWSWSFGDGGSSLEKNPSHTYPSPGTYTVALTTSNSFGSSTSTKTGYVMVGNTYASGYTALYYRGQTWTELAGTRTDASIHFTDQSSTWPADMVGRQENFSVTWDGYLFVPADATYSFRLTSDDGSWLWVDEVQLINNGGLHSSTAVSGSATLTAGYHHLVVKMYENTGVAVAYLDYAVSPSTIYVPATNVYHII